MYRLAFLLGAVCAPLTVAGANHASVEKPRDTTSLSVDDAGTTDCGKAAYFCSHATSARPDLFPTGPAGEPRGGGGNTDVTNYRLEIEILPQLDMNNEVTAVRVQGTNTIDVDVVDAPISEFVLDLDDTMIVTGVTGDVSGWSHTSDQIQVTLDRSYNPGESFQVIVEYNGEPDTAGFGAFQWWIRNGNLAVGTLSEPYFAPLWWPCKDSLSDKSTMEMIVTVPDPMVAASNGILESVTPVSGGRTRYSWHEINPMANYLASLAITNYERYDLSFESSDGNGGTLTMPVWCYLYPDHWDFGNNQPLAQDKAGCDELPTMLGVYELKFGPYPFRTEKYGVAETGGPGGLGANMEHQTITSMYRVRNYSDIMAHEMAHHWFGDNITCATWNDIWLNEGFASYLEAVYREFRPGGGVDSYWGRMNARYPDNPDARVYRDSIDSVGAIFSGNDVYNKGAWVCHMLRHVMGDAAFFQALTHYRATHQGGFATTAEFTAAMSNSFGHDLSFFTDEWVMNAGAPDYVWSYHTDNVKGTDYLYLRVAQEQNLEGFGLITMPIDIRVTTNSGTTVHRIWNDGLTEFYVIPLDGALVDVEFDEAGGVDDRHHVLTSTRTFDAGSPALPPVVVEATIKAIGATPGTSTAEVTFSEDIGSFDASDFELIGDATGTHAATGITYSALSKTALVTFSSLPNDSYTLRVIADNVSANGMPLDGEVDDSAWYDDVLLPSGDGQPGGDALFAFELLAGDANCNGVVTLDDVSVFAAVLLGTDTNACHVLRSDVNNDGSADGRDVAGFVDAVIGG